MSTLLSAIRRATPTALALDAPRQQVQWSYGELHQRVRQLAGGLRELGVGRGDVVASDLPNVCENLLLQLAIAHLGASFASAKDEKSLLAKVGEVRCAVVSPEASWLWGFAKTAPRAVLLDTVDAAASGAETGGFLTFSELASQAEDLQDEACAPDGLFASYGGSALTHGQAAALGASAAAALGTTSADKTCVSITLCHAFGMGSGVGGALTSGGAVVLPAADGIRGCGDPKQRAEVTAAVLLETRATLLIADSHIIQRLPLPETLASAAAVHGASSSGSGSGSSLALRGGLVKVSSGTEIFDTGLDYAGVPLRSIGKRP